MNLNDEYLNTSDDWLSEQLFAQLKDFNAEYKEKSNADFFMGETFQNCSANMPLLDDEITWQDLKPTPLDSFDTALKNSSFTPNYDINDGVLDLSHTDSKERQIETEQHEKTLFDLIENIPPKSVPHVQLASQIEANIKPPIFDATEEELKILKFLETQQTGNTITEIVASSAPIPSLPTTYKINCINCSVVLSSEEFEVHTCESRENENELKIQTTKSVTSCSSSKEENDSPLSVEPACMRLLRENQIRIRRFLKDELKYDVNSILNFSGTTVNSSSSGVNSSNTSVASINLNKKQEGPHECTLCERKFVHASGLLRHMEKHALDLIPSPNVVSNNKSAALQSAQSISGLRVVLKCNLCGRIFFDTNQVLNHFYSHFPDSETDEKENDDCAETPYFAYVDDAYNSLKTETGSSYDPSRVNYHEEKNAVYLKIVILSCILQCEFCDLVFSDVSYLFVHSAYHLPSRRFECFACDIHVKTSKEICNHWHAECVFMRENLKMHQATTQRYFVCNVCENKFQSMDLLHEHRYTSYHFFPRLNKSTGRLQLPCEYCESIFENAQECVTHYEEKHYRKYKRDKDCNSGSSKTRQYLCDICGKSYTQSSHLWQHLRFHQGVKPFACKEPGCTRKFTIRPDLNDHIRKCHTGERPYHCLVCGKRFLTGSVFYQHRLIHRGERRYECEACGKRFYRADALKNHQRIHTGEKPYGCHFCTKNFRQRGDRDKHIRARHSHLDANARLMMQMQKLQLEAAAQAEDSQNMPPKNYQECSPGATENIPLSQYEPEEVTQGRNNFDEIFMMSNLEFSKNLIESIMSDVI